MPMLFIHSFIHLVVCLTTGPKPLPKQALHILRSRASSLKWEYPLLSSRSSSSFLRFLPCLPVTYILSCIFPSITRCRRQFLRKMWPIQLAFRLLIWCRIFLCSLTLSNTSSFLTWSVQLIFSIILQHHISKLSRCFWSTARSVQVSACYSMLAMLYGYKIQFLTFSQIRIRVFGNRVVRNVLGYRRENVARIWRQMQSRELLYLYSSL